MAQLKTRRLNSLLGLALDERRLTVTVATRSLGGCKLTRSLHTTLTLDPLTAEPELVGREIRNALEKAGIRGSHCAVCIPLQWVLTLQVKIPDIPEADVPSFLTLEAERGLPYPPAEISLAVSRYKTAKGEACATLVGVPMTHVQRLEQVLRLAHLKPASFSLGLAVLAMAEPGERAGHVAIAIGEQAIELLVASGDGVVTLRAIEGAIDGDGPQRRLDTEVVSRELRITLGQLSKDMRESVRQATVIGGSDMVRTMIAGTAPALQSLGLKVTEAPGTRYAALNGSELPRFSGAASYQLAANLLTQGAPAFEFLPPKPSRWKQTLTRFGSRKVVSLGMAAAALVAVVLGAFGWQQWRLSKLQSQWRAVAPQVAVVDATAQQIRKYGAWYDESLPAMRILRALTEVFTEDGTLTAKTVEIKDLLEVSCDGQAKDSQAYLKLIDRMEVSENIGDYEMGQLRGETPKTFSFTFKWKKGGKGGR